MPLRVSRSIPLLLMLLHCGCTGRAVSLTADREVPLRTVEFSGHRYVVRADVGLAETVPIMIHGNAAMFLMLTHRPGERLNGGPVRKTEDYGYSSKGRGTLRLARMRLGGRTYSPIPPVPVFDFTENGDTLVQGMVGVRFLVAARAAVDFSRDRLLLGVVRGGPDRRLTGRGYRWARFSVGPGDRVTLPVRFPAIGRILLITPSTVSNALTLHRPLFAGRVPMSKTPSPDSSPNRTTPDQFVAEGVDFEIAGARMRSAASFEDFAEYANVPERDLDTFGMLGYDWMKEHKAILDYANRVLYFKP